MEEKSDRILAQVVKILNIETIKNADQIELATVLDWQVIVKKDEFKIGDLGIYYSIGSVLPKDNPNTEFLQGKVLKTKKIRGVISQGLLTPLSWAEYYNIDINTLKENDDLTNTLKVKKWVEEEELNEYKNKDGTCGVFPEIIRKTRENRIQDCGKKLKELENKEVVITQKYDGTSTTFMKYNDNFIICGRNRSLLTKTKETFHYFEIEEKYNLKENMLKYGKNIAIQGETIGPKINKNRHKMKNLEFYVFNIFDIDKQYYLNWEEVEKISSILQLKIVPAIYKGIMKKEWLSVKNLLELSDEQKYNNGDTPVFAEGIVIKSNYGFGFPRTSFKVISNNYLIKHKL